MRNKLFISNFPDERPLHCIPTCTSCLLLTAPPATQQWSRARAPTFTPRAVADLREVHGGGSENLSLQCVGLALAQAPWETSDKPGDASRWQLPGCDQGTRAAALCHAAVPAPSTKPPDLGPAERGLPGTWVMPVPTALSLSPALPLELLLFFFP